jgi:protoporphyrinogen oxidase
MTEDSGWSQIAILGAGLAGLGAGLALPGSRVFEARSNPGGHVYSHMQNGVAFDQGAHISHSKSKEFLALIYSAAGDVNEIEPSTVRNYWQGSWTGYPIQNHLRDLPEDLRVRALSDLVVANNRAVETSAPKTYRDWCLNQYGETLTDVFYEVFTRKYWRRDAADLATDWLGGRLIPADLANIVVGAFREDVRPQASFTRFHYPANGGFYSFFEPLFSRLIVALDHRVVEIDAHARTLFFESGAVESYERLASSIPLPELVSAIKDTPSSVVEAASKLRHTKLLCVNMVVSQPNLTDAHWCYIYDEGLEPARLSFPGNLAPGSVPSGTTAIQAEVFRDSAERWNPEVLTQRSVSQVADILGFSASTDVLSVAATVVSHAYVVSNHDRAKATAHILEWLKSKDIHSMGLYGTWEYMWSDAAFASGAATSRIIRESFA